MKFNTSTLKSLSFYMFFGTILFASNGLLGTNFMEGFGKTIASEIGSGTLRYGLNTPLAEDDCSTGFVFTQQSQIDNFSTNHPGCTQIQGDVIIDGSGFINLNGLSAITSISGNLEITNTFCDSLGGFDNLTTIGGNLIIDKNVQLEKFASLSLLQTVGGDLDISRNTALEELDGLGSLTTVGGRLYFNVSDLANLNGLEMLTSIGGELYFRRNNLLTSLSSLSNLTAISGKITFDRNDILPSLNGLDNIDYTTITDLELKNNPQLATCGVESICDYIHYGGSNSIFGNSTNCTSETKVKESCGYCDLGQLGLFLQSQIDDFATTYAGCVHVVQDVSISGGDITNLNGLSVLESIEGGLYISNASDLDSLSGLDNLEWVVGGVHIFDCDGLTSMKGLGNLDSIGGFGLEIHKNDALNSLGGLGNLNALSALHLWQNSALTSLVGLESVDTIMGNVILQENNSLTSCSGLDNLKLIGGGLHVDRSISLTSLTALNNLNSLDTLFLLGCDAITSLAGLENIDYQILSELAIAANPNLTFCHIQPICDYLENGGSSIIYGNKIGCENEVQIETACNDGDCLSEGIALTSQADIDNFRANYGNCSHILGNVTIDDFYNGDITNLDSLYGIASIEGWLVIQYTNALEDLSGLQNLQGIGDTLLLLYNDALTDISALGNLDTLGELLHITNNEVLSSLNGLENLYLDPNIGYMNISHNQNLSSCEAQGVCDFLGMGGIATINFNKSGCANQTEVEIFCNGACFLDGFTFFSQNQIDDFPANFPNCTAIYGDVVIGGAGSDITNLDSLIQLTGFHGYFRIFNTVSLPSLEGLDNVTFVGGDFTILQTTNLVSTMGMNNLTNIGGDFWIANTPGLSNLTGFSSLTNVEGSFQLNTSSNTLTALNGLENMDFQNVDNLTISGNPGLSFCHIQNVCDIVNPLDTTLIISISGNDVGCDNIPEVVAACNTIIPKNLILNQDTLASGEYIACDTIISAGHIPEDSTITYTAGKLIHLLPDFIAEGEFLAQIDDLCSEELQDQEKEVTYRQNQTSSPNNSTLIEIEKQLKLDIRPNLIKNTAVLVYELPTDEEIQIIFYDMTGREMGILLPKQRRPKGQHEWLWQPNGLPAGLYFISLVTQKERISKKVVLQMN